MGAGASLSFWTVGLQLLIGLGFALLLNMRSSLLQALRTVFLIPMVLPPIVVAIIWKVIYTPISARSIGPSSRSAGKCPR